MEREPELREKVEAIMDRYLQSGYAIIVDADQADPNRCWFLPTFVAKNPMKPEKVRIVMDAAARTRGVSLNDYLMTGPDLTEPLVHVLQRLRQGPVAVMGDVSEMYHQVSVVEEDRCAMRFLWRSKSGQLQIREMCVLPFGATCSPSIAHFVRNLNAEQHQNQFPEAAKSLKRNTYVEDWGTSRWSTEDLLAITNNVVQINEAAGFKMHKWMTNDPVMANYLDSESGGSGLVSMAENKVLECDGK